MISNVLLSGARDAAWTATPLRADHSCLLGAARTNVRRDGMLQIGPPPQPKRVPRGAGQQNQECDEPAERCVTRQPRAVWLHYIGGRFQRKWSEMEKADEEKPGARKNG